MKSLSKIGIAVVAIFAASLFIFAISGEEKSKQLKEGTAQYFPVEIDFAGEKVPLQIDDVKERFDRELIVNANLHSSTIIILKRANRAFPVIEPILAKYGVPDDFKYLAVIESALVNATSSAGAKGVWQFMPATAKEKGMEVTEVVDERYDLIKSTEAACNYLLKAKQKFGNWTLAAASYNGGMTGVQNKLDEQRVSSYYDVLLTDETARYVFRILALKEIMKNPAMYGFDLSEKELYKNLQTKTVMVDSTINNLADFAISQGINYKILKIHNPWMRDKKLLNPNKKVYQIEIPTEGY
jgi:hypothetical protein